MPAVVRIHGFGCMHLSEVKLPGLELIIAMLLPLRFDLATTLSALSDRRQRPRPVTLIGGLSKKKTKS